MRIVTLFLAALLATSPFALAGWAGKGAYEPDTLRDVSDGWMRLGPPEGLNDVYFNAFEAQWLGFHGGVGSSWNGNLATLESSRQSFSTKWYAMMGVWRDCNGDGFVGLGDQGLFEYPASLLPAGHPCGAQSVPATVPRGWKPVHNDGEWVREWLPIGYDQRAYQSSTGRDIADANIWNINDFGARVWADHGLPESAVGTRCYIFPPTGSLSKTGGMLEYTDCYTGNKITATINSFADAGGLDDLGFGQVSFADKPYDQSESASILNRANPWGQDRDASYAQAFDCDEGPIVQVQLTSTIGVGVSRPLLPPSGPDLAGSPAGTTNETANALDDCDREDDPGSPGNTPYAFERDLIQITTTRNRNDFTLQFNEGFRPGTPNLSALGKGASPDAGAGTLRVEGFWASTQRDAENRNPWVNRESLGPMEVSYVTTYARISASAIASYGLSVKGQPGVYGAEHCGADPTLQWECDPAKWWRNDQGGFIQDDGRDTNLGSGPDGFGATLWAVPGELYVARDIDCFDQSVGALRELDVTWGTLTGTACETP